MESARFLIVGGGMTGDAAVKGIREHDADGSIVLVGAERQPPYARPPLTKGLWSGADEKSIWRGTEDAGVQLRLGRRIVSLDLDARRASDDMGGEFAWEKLLLATGGRPRTPSRRATASSTTGLSTITGQCGRECATAPARW